MDVIKCVCCGHLNYNINITECERCHKKEGLLPKVSEEEYFEDLRKRRGYRKGC